MKVQDILFFELSPAHFKPAKKSKTNAEPFELL